MLGAVTPSEREVPEGELMQYAAMGTIIHGMAEALLLHDSSPTSLWQKYKEEWALVQGGSLQLRPSEANPGGFMDAHKEIEWMVSCEQVEVPMFDDDMMLCGTSDLFTTYKGQPCTLDWKTSRSYSKEKKLKYFKQLALYSLMKEKQTGVKDQFLIIAPLNPNNKCGYGKALITDEVDMYRELALKDLSIFNQMYNEKSVHTPKA